MSTNSLTALLTKLPTSTFLGEFLLFAGSTIILQASRLAVNLFAARELGPETWGLWYILNLVLAYSGVIHLGVINAMNREVPVFRGRSDADRVRLIQSVTTGFMLVSTLIAGLALVFVGLAASNLQLRGPLALLALLLTVTQPYIFLQTYLKSDGQFNRMSLQQLVFAGLLPLLAVPLTAAYGLPGFILAQTVATAAVTASMIRAWPFNFTPTFDWAEARRLMKVGLPIMLVGLLYTLLTTADRWVIAAFFETEQLGYYSLAIMVLAVTNLIPLVIAQQMYPRMAEAWGRTGQIQDVLTWAVRQSAMATVLTVPILFLIFFAAPPLVVNFLPAYEAGIPALRVILIGPLFLALSNGFGNMLNTIDKQVYGLIMQVLALLLNIGVSVLFVKAGLGITGVAWGTGLAYLVYGLLLTSVGVVLAKKPSSLPDSSH